MISKPVHSLSTREKEILRLISQEKTTKEIAHHLYLSDHTVFSHRKNLLEKLQVKNTAGLVRRGFELGILCVTNLSVER